MSTPESESPADGRYGPKTIEFLQKFFDGEQRSARPHFWVDANGNLRADMSLPPEPTLTEGMLDYLKLQESGPAFPILDEDGNVIYTKERPELVWLNESGQRVYPEIEKSFESMTPREQARHLFLDHGFDVGYFYSHFPHDDPLVMIYDFESMEGVLGYFMHQEGRDGMERWHNDDHEYTEIDLNTHEGGTGGGKRCHIHEQGAIPLDVLDSIDSAFRKSDG